MKMSQAILLFGILALVAVNATVFEAERSEDVDLFLDQSQNETVGLLFYDSKAENTDTQGWFSSLTSKILGVFMSQDQYGRSTEDWVEMFDDKLHLMRIDARNDKLMRSREEFNIGEDLPFIVLQDKQRTILRENVNDDTYDHVRDLLDRRPNILHKTGGAALKSFSLEPDSDKEESEPRVIQYFDLEEGEPTNVEEPIQRQYVNWGATDVIGPDGKWMERGRNWVTSYEIPQSGIKSQENPTRLNIKDRINDDPRPKPAAPVQPKLAAQTPAKPAAPAQPKPVAPAQPKPAAQAQPKPVAPAQSKPAAPVQPKPVAPAQPKPTAAPVQGKPVAAPVQGKPTATTSTKPVAAPTQAKPVVSSTAPKTTVTAQPTTQAKTISAVKTGSPQPTATAPADAQQQQHRYHDKGYTGYGYQYRGY